MSIEWDFLRGPLASVRDDLLGVLTQYARHKRELRIGVTSNPILSFVDHTDATGRAPENYVSERMVCIYESRSLDEALAACDLLLAHAHESFPELSARIDERNGIREVDDDLPFFVYLLGDSIYEFPGREASSTISPR